MADDLSPQALRALADRLEREASSAKEEAEVERIQRALESGQDALADKLVDRLLDRMGAHLEDVYDASYAADDEGGEGEDEAEEGDEAAGEEAGEEEESSEHEGILPGRWRPVRVFGAKIYSGPAEPDTVRFRNEKGQIQSRPGRVPGKPYQAEWEQLPDNDDGGEAAGEGVEDAA